MTRLVRRFAAVGLAFVIALLLTSCASSNSMTMVLVDQTASTSAQTVRDSYTAAMTEVVKSLKAGAHITGGTIGASSIAQSSAIFDAVLPKYSVLGGHDAVSSMRKLGPADDAARAQVLTAFAKAVQRSNENASCIVDGIAEAGRVLRSSAATSRALVIMSDGIEECGSSQDGLDFVMNVPDPARSIAVLRGEHRLPDLRNTQVFWTGLLDSSVSPVDPSVGQRIRDWWTQFFVACGAALSPTQLGGPLSGWTEWASSH